MNIQLPNDTYMITMIEGYGEKNVYRCAIQVMKENGEIDKTKPKIDIKLNTGILYNIEIDALKSRIQELEADIVALNCMTGEGGC